MRTFALRDPLEQVRGGADISKGKEIAGTGIGLLFGIAFVAVGVGGVMSSEVEPMHFGFLALGALICAGLLARYVRGGWFWMAGIPLIALIFSAFAWEYSPQFIGPLCVAFFLILFLLQVRYWRQSRRIAGEMQKRSGEPCAACQKPRPEPELPRVAPPLSIQVYQVSELAPLTYRGGCGAEFNMVGQTPCPILYLYNFAHFKTRLKDTVWRRFGPVYLLASPRTLLEKFQWSPTYMREVEKGLLPDCASVDRRLDHAAQVPLSSPSYPEHQLICSDISWRHAATRLMDQVGLVVFDAVCYSTAREGLKWEIASAVNRVATANMVILIDDETDFVALAGQFRTAWAQMRPDSPNNRANAGPLRFVLTGPAAQPDDRDRYQADGPNYSGKYNGYQDRIYGLLSPIARGKAV